MPDRLSALVLCLLLAASALARAADRVAAAAPEGSEEPPAEFTLEIDGQSVDVQTGAPAKAIVAGKEVTLRLTPKPTRLLKTPEFSFRFPRGYSFEHEQDGGTTTWTLSGNNNTLIVTRVAQKLDSATLAGETLKAMQAQLRQQDVRPTKVTAKLGGRTIEGLHAEWRVGDQRIRNDVYAFAAGGATYALIVQDSPTESGATSDDTRKAVELLEATMKFGE